MARKSDYFATQSFVFSIVFNVSFLGKKFQKLWKLFVCEKNWNETSHNFSTDNDLCYLLVLSLSFINFRLKLFTRKKTFARSLESLKR